MTFTIKTGHHWQYLTDQVGKGRENYYLNAVDQGEPPGIWQGRGAEALGLTGEVESQDMEALYGNFVDPRDAAFHDPDSWETAAKLGRPPRNYASPEDVLAKLLAAEPDAMPERVDALRARAEKEARHAVAFLDLTFSVPKSVTVLHTALRAQEVAAQRAGHVETAIEWNRQAQLVEQAIWAGNNAGLEYWAEYAGYSRTGYHGAKGPDGASVGQYVDGHDWVIASFFQHTSRKNDPQLHVHNAVLNRVENPDGQWRTLDSRAVHRVRPGAAAVAERTMFEQLIRDLGVEVAMRPDGKSLEITTVPQAARDLFSSRRQAVTAELARRVDAFVQRYGHEPNALQLSRLAQEATLYTRPGKSHDFVSYGEELDRWSAELRAETDTTMAEVAATSIGRVPDPASAAQPFDPERVIDQALSQVQQTKAAWTRHDLVRALNDQLPGILGGLSPQHTRRLLDELADMTLRPAAERVGTSAEVVRLTAPELVTAPDEMRRADGRSVFEAPASEVYATVAEMRAEERLIRAGQQTGAPRVPAERIAAVIADAGAGERPLGPDQAAAVRGVLGSGNRLEVIIGLAGAGKSRTVGTIAEAWERETGGRVFGLASSQAATFVLQNEGLQRAANITQWLNSQRRLDGGSAARSDYQWALRPEDLVVVDEAGMTPNPDMDSIRAHVEAAGARLLAVGDDRQLPAVGAGGALRLLAQTATTYKLTEVRRMRAEWERAASARLRVGDQDVLHEYERHGRLVDGGTAQQTGQMASQTWLASTLDGKRALLIVDTNQQATDLSEHLRARLIDLGLVEEAGERIGLAEDPDNTRTVAGVGDVIQVRRNDWRRRGPDGRVLTNRDLYRIVGRPGDGSLEARRISFDENNVEQLGPTVTIPAAYLQQHATLGYAVTEYGAQGATVHASYPVVSQGTSAAAFYVAMSRGTDENVAFIETIPTDESPAEVQIHDTAVLRAGRESSTPLQVATGILERYEPERAALEVERDSFQFTGSLTNLGVQWAAAIERTNRERFAALADRLAAEGRLTEAQRARLETDDAAGPMWRVVRAAELAGHDSYELMSDAIGGRSLADANSLAKVLHHRLTNRLEGRLVAAGDSYTERTPQVDTPVGRFARDLAVAMDARMQALGEEVAEEAPEWATRRLGLVPADLMGRADWVARAGRAAAYREQYLDQAGEVDAIGSCPPAAMPEARASWYAAWRALGEPEERRAEAELTVAQLRERVAAYAREEAWAPEWVGDQLRNTTLAQRTHREQAILLNAAAQVQANPDRRTEILADAAVHAELADRLEEARQQLEEIDAGRARWYLHTVEARAQFQAAKAELDIRGEDVEPAVTTTAAEFVGARTAAEHGRDRNDAQEVGAGAETEPATSTTGDELTVVAGATDRTAEVEYGLAEDQAEMVDQSQTADAGLTGQQTQVQELGAETTDAGQEQVTRTDVEQPKVAEVAEAEADAQDAGQAEHTAEREREPVQAGQESSWAEWPSDVPTLAELAVKIEQTREAIRIMGEREREQAARDAEEAHRRDMEADYDRQREEELRRDGPSLSL